MHSSYTKSIIFALALFSVSLSSCKKQTVYEGHPVIVYIFNGLDNEVSLYGNYSDSVNILYSLGQHIPNKSGFETRFENPSVRARYFASPDTLAKDHPVFEKQLDLQNGRIYSMYLTGDKSEIDYLFVENQLKDHNTNDSVTYMQVVNISNDQPISVNIKGAPDGSLINSLPYKGLTDFMEVNADHNNPDYEFEFRDATTGELLITVPVPDISISGGFLHRNWALVFNGKRGATDVNALSASLIRY